MTGSERMAFWKTVNEILKSRGEPEMLFGEARGWMDRHDDNKREIYIEDASRCMAA